MARGKRNRCGNTLRVTIQDQHGRIERILAFAEFQTLRDRDEYKRVTATLYRRRPPAYIVNDKAPNSAAELTLGDMLRVAGLAHCGKIQRERLIGHLKLWPRLAA